MKPASTIILALIYFIFTVGATIHRHYCMGELVGKSFIPFHNKDCSKCGMKKHTAASRNCCADVTEVYKNSEAHNLTQIAFVFHDSPVIITDTPFINDVYFSQITTIKDASSNSPPVLKHPLFIQYRNFRI